MEKQKFYLVAADALPEVFLRVAEAKRMLQVGEAATVGDAARQVGISRSAFYKYKDAVQPFQNMHAGHIITFYALLKDNPGVARIVLCLDNDGPGRTASAAIQKKLSEYEVIDNSPHRGKDYNDQLQLVKGISGRVKTRGGEAR